MFAQTAIRGLSRSLKSIAKTQGVGSAQASAQLRPRRGTSAGCLSARIHRHAMAVIAASHSQNANPESRSPQ
jgi:hypothetical protein